MMKLLRSIHAWIGFFVIPWVIMIGLTGLYLNHSKQINGLIYTANIDEALISQIPAKPVVDRNLVRQLAERIWGVAYQGEIKEGMYHKHNVYVLGKKPEKLLVSKDTGHYWLKSRFTRNTFNSEGGLLYTKIYWGRIFKYIHTDGWVGGRLGSWLADITAGAMVVFGFSGMVLFLYPRIRRIRNRRLRGVN